jgi:calcineurin-like phosphoesterase family protein
LTKIVLFGDPDVTTDAKDIYNAVDKEENVALYVNIGDNGYNGKGKAAVELIKQHFPDGSEKKNKFVMVLGNHDDGESESDENEELLGAYLPEQYKTKPEFEGTDQSWQDTRWLTNRQVGDIYFIGMNSQDMDVEFKRNQFNWVSQQIEIAKKLRSEGKIKWIINAVHKPWFTLKSSHSPYTAVREIYSDLFKNVVNQNWHGHNHNDQAWWSMIAKNEEGNAAGEQLQTLLADGKTIDHSKEHGWTTNINGHSGHEHNAFKENATANKNVMWANDKTFSYTVVESNGDILNTKWKDKTGNVLFEYNISQAGGTGPPPDPDPDCPPGQHKDANGNCVPDVITCPPGQHLENGICVDDTTNPPPPPPDPEPTGIICPEGYTLDKSLGHCIPKPETFVGPKCPTGYRWNFVTKICDKIGTTEPPPDPECPPGQHKNANGDCVPDVITCPAGQHWDGTKCVPDVITCPPGQHLENGICVPDTTNPPDPGEGEVDANGVIWFLPEVKGKQTIVVPQSRDEADDDRWSQNVEGCEQGFEQTMIAKSIGIASDGHFASKLGGSNHSKGDWAKERWMDLGVRSDGTVQLQWEGPHPSNHDFDLPDTKLFLTNIGKPLEGNWIGLKWAQNILKPGGTPADGGVRWRMWVNTDIATDGKPDNTKWKLVLDFIDGVDVKVIQPQTFRMTGTMDVEVRRSGTKSHEVYAGGLLIRPFGSSTTPPPPPPPPTENCPQGEHWDSGLGKCVEDVVTPPPPPPIEGNVIWDSNVHLKTGQKYTITDKYGDQKADGKGVFMAASGSPHVNVEADGTFYLEADAGHGRMYIKATNFNSIMEGEIMFPDSFDVVRNSTQRLRSRHQEGGSEGNNFGGFGQTIEVQEQLAEYETEPYHNVHENPIKKPLAKKIEQGKWVKFRYTCKNSPDNKKVLFNTDYDYNDGQGWVNVNSGEHPTPKPYYMDEALYMKESYAWLRINNEAKGRVGFKNVRIIKL